MSITDGLEECPWPTGPKSSAKQAKRLWQSTNDAAFLRRKRRAAWMGLLAAATQFDSEHSDYRAFARRDLRRCARVLLELGADPTPLGEEPDVEGS